MWKYCICSRRSLLFIKISRSTDPPTHRPTDQLTIQQAMLWEKVLQKDSFSFSFLNQNKTSDADLTTPFRFLTVYIYAYINVGELEKWNKGKV